MAFSTLVKDADGTPLSQGYLPGSSFTANMISPLYYIDGSNNQSGGVVTADQIQAAIMLGLGYSATTTALATATNGNLTMGMTLFNPASAKSFYVYSIEWNAAEATTALRYNHITTDPGYSNTITPSNQKPGGAASVAVAKSAANGATASVSVSGTQHDMAFVSAQGTVEFLPNNCGILLPAGSNNGIAVYGLVVTAAKQWGCSMRWIEF